MNALDIERLRLALDLAQAAIGVTEPNPRVGCVIGHEDGRVLGRGATQQAGGAHAEVMALREARSLGLSTAGATAWVTLEPCAHHGRTPPCCDALIAAGLARVVVAVQDPFDRVAGAGIERLRAHGLQVVLAEGELALAAWELNIGFFSRVLRRRPWVRIKVAASVDGRTALDNGNSQWITSEAARIDSHRWRRRASAVLTGVGTVIADDPRLDVRWVSTAAQPLRVVLDSRLRTPPAARLLMPPGQTLLVTTEAMRDTAPSHALLQAGASLRYLPAQAQQVSIAAVLSSLAEDGINEVHVEAGSVLNAALACSGLVDEWLLYLAPKLLGPGRGVIEGPELQALGQAQTLETVEVSRLGPDLCWRLRTPAGSRFALAGQCKTSEVFTTAPHANEG